MWCTCIACTHTHMQSNLSLQTNIFALCSGCCCCIHFSNMLLSMLWHRREKERPSFLFRNYTICKSKFHVGDVVRWHRWAQTHIYKTHFLDAMALTFFSMFSAESFPHETENHMCISGNSISSHTQHTRRHSPCMNSRKKTICRTLLWHFTRNFC